MQAGWTGDSIYDQTKHWHMKNTFATAMLGRFQQMGKGRLEGFRQATTSPL